MALIKAQVVDSFVVRVQIGRRHGLFYGDNTAIRFLLQLQSLINLALLLLELISDKVAVVHGKLRQPLVRDVTHVLRREVYNFGCADSLRIS